MFTYQVINMSSPVHCRVVFEIKADCDENAKYLVKFNKIDMAETMVLVRVVERD